MPQTALGTGADGFAVVVEKADGVHVCVVPPLEGGRPVTVEEARDRLRAHGLGAFDEGALARAVTEATGEEVRVAEPSASNPPAPAEIAADLHDVVVEVSRDRMRAYLSLLPPTDPEEAAPARRMGRVLGALRAAGVVYGIRRDEIRRLVETGRRVEGALVAAGDPPEDGQDARVEFAFDPEPRYRPHERPDGSVDHKEVRLIQSVQEGQVLARLEPATPGRAGMRVDGRAVPHRPGVDRLLVAAGRNVEEREGGRLFVATETGHPSWDGRRVSVNPVYTVRGDVDASTGNVRFDGDVRVEGWVRQGYVVRAGGDVEVLGGVEGAEVVSTGGSIWVHGGIRGGAKVRAAKDVAARFVEGSEATGMRDVAIGDAALHAEISAGRTVRALHGRGLLLGGVARAQVSIQARVLGSWSEAAEETHVRIEHVRTREILAEIVALEEKIRAAESDARRVTALLEAFPAGLERRDRIGERLRRAREVLHSNREAFLREKQRRERLLGSIRGGEVRVIQRIHPGAVVTIGHRSFKIEHRTAGCTFFRDGNEIRWM